MGVSLRKPLQEFREATDSTASNCQTPEKDAAILQDDPRSPTVGIHRTPIEVTPTFKPCVAASNDAFDFGSPYEPKSKAPSAYHKAPDKAAAPNLHRELMEASLGPKRSTPSSAPGQPTTSAAAAHS